MCTPRRSWPQRRSRLGPPTSSSCSRLLCPHSPAGSAARLSPCPPSPPPLCPLSGRRPSPRR
eukprot:778310-Pyramimonas_sp.AAC.2